MIADEPRYAEFKAFRHGQVWVYERLASAGGANDYWSRSVTRPDLLLADLVKIFHPSLVPDHRLRVVHPGAVEVSRWRSQPLSTWPRARPKRIDTDALVRSRSREALVVAGLAALLLIVFLSVVDRRLDVDPSGARLVDPARRQVACATAKRSLSFAIRLPRSVTAVLAGASLGVAGLQMQTLFRNPLADPFALGVSAGASLGVAILVLGSGLGATVMFGATLGLTGDAALTAAAIGGASLVLGLVLAVSARVAKPHHSPDPRPDVRIRRRPRSSRCSWAPPSPIGCSSGPQWGFGSFSGVTWQRLRLFGPLTLVGIVIGVDDDEAVERAAARESTTRGRWAWRFAGSVSSRCSARRCSGRW